MSLRVGDPIFSPNGQPGVVRQSDEDKKTLLYEIDKDKIKENIRHGYIQGLSLDQRDAFNQLMDEVVTLEEPKERIIKIQDAIQTLAKEPSPQNLTLARYLKSEMSHLMNSYNLHPQTYEITYYQIPT